MESPFSTHATRSLFKNRIQNTTFGITNFTSSSYYNKATARGNPERRFVPRIGVGLIHQRLHERTVIHERTANIRSSTVIFRSTLVLPNLQRSVEIVPVVPDATCFTTSANGHQPRTLPSLTTRLSTLHCWTLFE